MHMEKMRKQEAEAEDPVLTVAGREIRFSTSTEEMASDRMAEAICGAAVLASMGYRSKMATSMLKRKIPSFLSLL